MINAINPSYSNNYNRNYKPRLPKAQTQMSFKAHPDFLKLAKEYEVTASSYFRRGQFYGSPSDYFQDIVDVFKHIFSPASTTPKKMLIAGIGDSQETFSYLATIKDIKRNKPIAEVVDLHTIDLQSKPTPEKIYESSFYDHSREPDFVPDSFIEKPKKDKYGIFPYYRVISDILDFVQDTYANPQKSQWERRLQEALPEFKEESFDIISINNTLGYIKDPEDRFNALRNVLKILKKGGLFITDPFYGPRMEKAGVAEAFKEIKDGIYIKINDKITPPKETI